MSWVPLHRPLGLLCSLVAVLGMSATPAAIAAPADRGSALAAFGAEQQDEKAAAGWTGSVNGCVVGTESQESLSATLRAVNRLRDFAGLAPVTFDAELSRKALAAALMMRAANALDHHPGVGWPCYSSDGADAAGHSNLYLGRSGAAAIVGYVQDEGVASLGHRRWVLDPGATVFGSGSTGMSNALYVISPAAPATVPGDRTVAWPPSGWVPWEWIAPDWSLTVNPPGQTVAFQNPQVTMTVDGTPVAVQGLQDMGSGFGSGQTLKWQPALTEGLRGADHVIGVTVTGVIINGQAQPVSWTVDAFTAVAPTTQNRPVTRARFVRGPFVRRRGRSGALLPVVALLRVGDRLGASATVSGSRITAYRWLRDGRPILGAIRASYRVRAADRGHLLSVRVTATTRDGRSTARRTSTSVRVRR